MPDQPGDPCLERPRLVQDYIVVNPENALKPSTVHCGLGVPAVPTLGFNRD
jgi:hypothetical protein